MLKSNWTLLEGRVSDERRGVPVPPVQVPWEGTPTILPPPRASLLSLTDAVDSRRSVRSFKPEPLMPDELSWLLHAVSGVRKRVRRQDGGEITLRTVPSAGARHPLETLVAVFNVEDLTPGLYRYLPLDGALAFTGLTPSRSEMTAACLGQRFCGESAAVFVWSAVPYRTEWRYGPVSPKLVALDAGHLCQNLYLAVEAVGAGTCAIGAYDQELADAMCGLDGRDEFVVYMAPVGKVTAGGS